MKFNDIPLAVRQFRKNLVQAWLRAKSPAERRQIIASATAPKSNIAQRLTGLLRTDAGIIDAKQTELNA